MFQFEVPLCFFFPLGDYSGRCIISWDPGTEAQMDYLQIWICIGVIVIIEEIYGKWTSWKFHV